MKIVKVLIITSICAFGFSPIFGQKEFKQVKSPEERSEIRTEKITEELDLSEEQTAKLSVINEKYATERKRLAEENRIQREKNREAMKKLSESQNQEINNLLTPAQRSKMEEHRKKRMDVRKEKQEEFKEKRMNKSDQK